jgi:hypothetical protein
VEKSYLLLVLEEALKEMLVRLVLQEYLVHRERKVRKVRKETRVKKEIKEIRVLKVLKVLKVPLVEATEQTDIEWNLSINVLLMKLLLIQFKLQQAFKKTNMFLQDGPITQRV